MSFITSTRVISPQPDDYTPPPFPSLYWPFPWQSRQSQFLYHTHDIWLFTLYWTLICYLAIHSTASIIALSVHAKKWRRNWRVIWVAPVVFGVVGAGEAVVSGSVVGGVLGAIYNAGYFRMSTWVPFAWAVINSLVVILSSFAIQGGL